MASVLPVVRVRPTRGLSSLGLGELWEHRQLAYFLVWRDVKVRYKQTLLGIVWAVLQPLVTMVVFSVIFGGLGRVPSAGLPYPILVYSALLPWQLFASALSNGGNSLVQNQNLVTKVYFSRLAVPVAAVLSGLVDFAISLAILAAMMAFYRIRPGWALLWLPALLLLALATGLACALWLAALNARYRDIRNTIPLLTMVWMFATPVAYPADFLPLAWRARVLLLNPMAAVAEGFRWALLNRGHGIGWPTLATALGVLVVLAGGLVFFRHTERTLADLV